MEREQREVRERLMRNVEEKRDIFRDYVQAREDSQD